MPDVFDQIAAEQAPAAAPRPAAGPGRGGRAPDVFDQVHAEAQQQSSAFHPLDAAANAISNWWDQVHHGPLNLYDTGKGLVGIATGETEHAMADENVALWQKVKDAYNARDPAIAVHALNYVLNGIPGLSLGTHLSRAGEKFQKGDISGGIGDTLGTATNLLTLAKSPQVADTVVENGPRAAIAAREAIKAAAPDVAKGAGTAAASAAIAHYVPGGAAINYAAGMGELKGATQAVRGLVKGFEAGKNAWADNLAERIARDRGAAKAAAAGAAAAEPGTAAWEPGPAGTPPPPEHWEPYTAAGTPAPPSSAWEPGPQGTPAPPLKAEHIEQYDAAAAAKPEAQPAGDVFDQIHAEATGEPDARATLPPELAARVEQLRAETHSPEELARVRLADQITASDARNQMQAGDKEWGARAAKADHIAEFVLRHNLEQTPAMYAKVADELGYDKPPSAETVPMIEDRLEWFRGRHPALAPAPAEVMPAPAQIAAPAASIGQMDPRAVSAAAPDLEQQLRDSLAARGVPVNLESGRPAETETETVRGTGTGAADQTGRLLESRTGNGASLPEASSGSESGQPAAAGERKTVRVPGEAKQYGARYEVRELSDLQPSHNGQTFQKNPAYEHTNDRDYNNPDNQRKIVDASVGGDTGFDPRYVINTAPDASIGPPVADSRGNVLGGNGRTMTLQRVFESNPAGAAEYRALLDRNAHHFGIDPADYAHMKQPVLVRVLDAAETGDAAAVQRAVTDFNKVGTAALTPAERAIADAHGVSQKTLDDIGRRIEHAGSDATLNSMLDEGRNGVDILQNLINDGVISPQERATLASADELKPMGRARVSNLMLGRFFTNAQQLDNLPNAIRAKMERMAAPLARAEGSPEYSLSPTVREALDLIDAADMHGVANLRDFVNQKELYSDTRQFSPASLRIAEQLRTRDPVALTNATRQYAARAKEAADYQGPGVFGDIPEPLTRGEAFDESFGSAALERDRIAKEAEKAKKTAAKAAKKAAEVAAE